MNGTVVFLILITGFLFLGIALTSIGIIIRTVFRKRATVCTAQTLATVIENNRIISRGQYNTWNPVFSYIVNGQEFIVHSNIGETQKAFREGQKVTLFYNPKNPGEYYVPEEKNSLIANFFIFLGIVFMLIGILCIILKITLL